MVIGWPRSGTHWLRSILSQALGYDIQHLHKVPLRIREMCGLFIVRDPRDAFLSHYHLYNRTHLPRTQMQHFEQFFCGKGMGQPNFRLGWGNYVGLMLGLVAESPNVVLVRFEDMKLRTVSCLQAALGKIYMFPSRHRLVRAVIAYGRTRCDPSNMPVCDELGKAGEWKIELEADVCEALVSYCGDVMSELGYD